MQIFEKHPDADAYRVNRFYEPYALNASHKRFTDAELAAEYWRTAQDIAYIVEGITWEGMCNGWSTNEDDALERLATLDRFATASHYDE